jgi:hypothetical protein
MRTKVSSTKMLRKRGYDFECLEKGIRGPVSTTARRHGRLPLKCTKSGGAAYWESSIFVRYCIRKHPRWNVRNFWNLQAASCTLDAGYVQMRWRVAIS